MRSLKRFVIVVFSLLESIQILGQAIYDFVASPRVFYAHIDPRLLTSYLTVLSANSPDKAQKLWDNTLSTIAAESQTLVPKGLKMLNDIVSAASEGEIPSDLRAEKVTLDETLRGLTAKVVSGDRQAGETVASLVLHSSE